MEFSKSEHVIVCTFGQKVNLTNVVNLTLGLLRSEPTTLSVSMSNIYPKDPHLSPFRFNKISHCLDIPNKTIPWLWRSTIKNTSNQRTNSGVFPHWLPLNVVMKSRYCRPIIIYSSILKPILKELGPKL